MDPKQSDALDRVMDLVRFLRTHCPWDAAQTPRSLVPYLLEEAHESAEAIAADDDDGLRSELGDLLLNVAFQIVLAGERQAFSADDVADTVIEKMRRRHPHLYGLGEKEDWEALKARERSTAAGVLHGVARGLDPLSRAHRIQDRVSAVGFDWADYRGAFDKVAEELEEVREQLEGQNSRTTEQQNSRTTEQQNNRTEEEQDGRKAEQQKSGTADLRNGGAAEGRSGGPAAPAAGGGNGGALEEELGDLLFAVVNLSRLTGVHALVAIKRANAKFTRRFEALEALAAERGLVLERIGLEALDVLWDEVKRVEANAGDGTPGPADR